LDNQVVEKKSRRGVGVFVALGVLAALLIIVVILLYQHQLARWPFRPRPLGAEQGLRLPLSSASVAITGVAPSAAVPTVSPKAIEVVAEQLEIPWDVEQLPDGDLLVTERPGRLLRIGSDKVVIPIEGVHHRGEGGLLGLALHPDFAQTPWVYLYLTTNEGGTVSNRVERYLLRGSRLESRQVILADIPGALNHDGGQLAFGPDNLLYITTGDAGEEHLAQNTQSLAGKILRLHDDGRVPADNPFSHAVYSYGHRNVQGITWDDQARLWATEHGRSGALSGFDELNLIEQGKNYGWPTIQGDETRSGMEEPSLHSGADATWAPASAAFWDGSIFFGGLRGQALYEAKLGGGGVQLIAHLHQEYGRIRAVTVGRDGNLYITTSNRDGRGDAKSQDDILVRIPPQLFR
jgi:glucose/arabinose dehydrogenase